MGPSRPSLGRIFASAANRRARRDPSLEAELMLVVQEEADVLKVHFSAHKILTEVGIEDVGRELLGLTEHSSGKILLDFQGVELMSSSMFGKLIALNKKCKSVDIDLRICNLSRICCMIV